MSVATPSKPEPTVAPAAVEPIVEARASPQQVARSGPGFAYMMIGFALVSLVISGTFGSIFCPDVVSGVQQDHFRIGPTTGWIWDAIALAIFLPVAMRGIRAGVTDRAPWTILGLGFSAIWLASMFITVFAPVWVYGTPPTQFPWTAGIGAIAALIFTAILCNIVKTGSFQPAESKVGFVSTTPPLGLESDTGDTVIRLRQLAQLRDSGAITESEFQAKKNDLLSRI